MTLHFLRVSLTAIVLCGFLLVSAGSRAQEGTPASGGEIISADACLAEPRPPTFLGEIILTPQSAEPYEMPTSVPVGTAPSDQTAADVTAAMREVIACSNGGEVLRALTLFSDEYLRRSVDPDGELDPDAAAELSSRFATPVVVEPDQLVVFIGIRQIVQLERGRVAVVVETDGGAPNEPGTDVDLFVFERIGERWIVVEAVNDIDDLEAEATPTS